MKKSKTPTAVITAILTLTTLLFWAGFSVYRSFTTKQAPTVPQEIINPLDPTLNTDSLNSIQGRLFLDDSQIGNTVNQTPSPSSTGTPLETPIASPTGTPTSTPSPTPTATP